MEADVGAVRGSRSSLLPSLVKRLLVSISWIVA